MWPYVPVLHNAQAMHKESKLIKYTEKFKRNYSLSFYFLLDCLICHFKWQPFVVRFKVATLFGFQYKDSIIRKAQATSEKDNEKALVNHFITWVWKMVPIYSSFMLCTQASNQTPKIVQGVKRWSGLDKTTQRSCRGLNPSLWNACIAFRKSHKVNKQFASK